MRVSNAFGGTDSASATLTVNDGLVTTYTRQLIGLNGTWRFDQSGVDLGTSWRAPGFNDGGWLSGQSLLGYEIITPYPEPFQSKRQQRPGFNHHLLFPDAFHIEQRLERGGNADVDEPPG